MFRTFIGVLCMCVLAVNLLSPTPVAAASVSDEQIEAQESVVREQATDTIQAYLRLLLYTLIERLEARVDA